MELAPPACTISPTGHRPAGWKLVLPQGRATSSRTPHRVTRGRYPAHQDWWLNGTAIFCFGDGWTMRWLKNCCSIFRFMGNPRRQQIFRSTLVVWFRWEFESCLGEFCHCLGWNAGHGQDLIKCFRHPPKLLGIYTYIKPPSLSGGKTKGNVEIINCFFIGI